MSELRLVKVGWSVRIWFKDGGPPLVGQVSQVFDKHGKWVRVGSMDTSHCISYSKIDRIQVLDSTTEIISERVT